MEKKGVDLEEKKDEYKKKKSVAFKASSSSKNKGKSKKEESSEDEDTSTLVLTTAIRSEVTAKRYSRRTRESPKVALRCNSPNQ